MTDDRAVRYRRLAMKEPNPEAAKLLWLLAEQAEQGILHPPSVKPTSEKPIAVKAD